MVVVVFAVDLDVDLIVLVAPVLVEMFLIMVGLGFSSRSINLLGRRY